MPTERRFVAVIFDMDGVLLDTETIADEAWRFAARTLDMPGLLENTELLLGCSSRDIHAAVVAQCKSEASAAVFFQRANDYFREKEMKVGIALKPGVPEVLVFLRENDYRIALASSTDGVTVRRQLTAAGLIDFFETITTGDMVAHSKPDPAIYRTACASLALAPAACLAVEDSPNGITSAHRAGMSCVMVPDRVPPSAAIEPLVWKICTSLRELPAIL
ncbi:MAG: HAD family phosphatase [Treponema sp.]|nr:HAD family phosphatase [Treponema sp.]